jgi:AhpD family alkylhydroperoxidase
MARVPVHDLDSAPDESKEPLRRQSERLGKTLNIHASMANSPALIGMYDAADQALRERSSLGDAARSAIHLTVANVNDCDYCQAAYTGSARKNGFSEEQTLQIRQGVLDDDEKLTALLTFAREITDRRGYVADETWQATLDAGWSEQALLDAYAEVVRTVLTNWFNHLNDTDLDLPPAPPLEE